MKLEEISTLKDQMDVLVDDHARMEALVALCSDPSGSIADVLTVDLEDGTICIYRGETLIAEGEDLREALDTIVEDQDE
jgi:hypothetical protein